MSARCLPPFVAVAPGVNRLPSLAFSFVFVGVVAPDASFAAEVGSTVETAPDPVFSSPDAAPAFGDGASSFSSDNLRLCG